MQETINNVELKEPKISAELQGKNIRQSVELKDIPAEFKRWFIKTFKDNARKIDVLHEYDRDISVAENITQFEDKFEVLVADDEKLREQVANVKGQIAKSKHETEQKLKEQEREIIDRWKKSDYQKIYIKSFDVPKAMIKRVCDPSALLKGVTLVGETSLGKTILAINTIKEESKADICELENTYTSPLELYKLLYRYQSEYEKKQKVEGGFKVFGKIIAKPFFIVVFDDVEGLLTDRKSNAVLKSALWETNGQRIIKMNTIDRVLGDVPKAFEFTGHIIILANRLNLNDVNINAVKERTHYFELKFKYSEKLKVMSEIVKTEYPSTTLELRQKALDILVRNSDLSTQDFNFRTLIRAYDYMAYGEKEAEHLVKATLKSDERLTFILNLIDKSRKVDKEVEEMRAKPVEEQSNEFALRFDSSRMTFFRLKKKLLGMMI